MIRILLIVTYISTIIAANYAVQHYGLVSVGFGLLAPAGVYFAGLALGIRDGIQRTAGRPVVVMCILVGAGISYLITPSLALASGTAFLISELADFSIYTPLEERNIWAAVLASNTVGAAVDSALFLWIAFDSLAFFKGQFVGKLEMTIPVLIVLAVYRATRRPVAA